MMLVYRESNVMNRNALEINEVNMWGILGRNAGTYTNKQLIH